MNSNIKRFFVIIIGLLPSLLLAQTSLEASQGDTLYHKAAYFQAIGFYKNVILHSKDTLEVCHCKKQLAKCYTQLNQLGNAEQTYKDIIQTCKTDPSDLRNFARILQKEGEYEKAKRLYASCYHADTNDRFSYENMYFCDTIRQAIDRLSEVYLENMHEVNSVFDDVVNEVNNDTLHFLSARKGIKSDSKLISNDQYPFRMYSWNAAHNKKVELLSQNAGDGFSTSNLDDNEVFFSMSEPHKKDETLTRTVIYRSKRTTTGLSEPQKFGFDDDSSAFGHPNLSPDGNMFFFVSDMPGGFGGMDIYLCRKTGNKWSSPINLGSGINTPDNELFPFYLGQGILFFSSNGHAGFGGYDLYSTTFKKDQWVKATNLSIPINSKGDDMALRCDKTKKTFYLTSNRPKGKGGLDIYKVQQFKISDFRGR
jgi:hypothetical protein